MQLMNQGGLDCLDNSLILRNGAGKATPLAASGQEEHGAGDCEHLLHGTTWLQLGFVLGQPALCLPAQQTLSESPQLLFS